MGDADVVDLLKRQIYREREKINFLCCSFSLHSEFNYVEDDFMLWWS